MEIDWSLSPIVSSGLPHGLPLITEDFARRPESIVTTGRHAPSDPGLAFEDAERGRQEAFQHHQQRWEDLMLKMLKNFVSSISESMKKSEIKSSLKMRTGIISKLNDGEMKSLGHLKIG